MIYGALKNASIMNEYWLGTGKTPRYENIQTIIADFLRLAQLHGHKMYNTFATIW